MKKMRLDLDALSVESFRTTGHEANERGTVHAHRPPPTEDWNCPTWDTCTDLDCTGTAASECGTCATNCGSCYDATCGATYCGTCETNCGTCDPYCCCSCSCC